MQHKLQEMLSNTPKYDGQKSLFFSLADTLNANHPLYKLAEKIDWKFFEEEFKPL